MLELNLIAGDIPRDKDFPKHPKPKQLFALEFGNIKITGYPPQRVTVDERQQFDADVLAAAQSASNEIKREVPADSIRWIVSAYACRKFALQEVMPAANALANELQAVIDAYNERNGGGLGGLLEQLTGAAEPLAEALNRLNLPKTDNRIDMPKLLFIADMARLYADLTGKVAGKTADGDHGSPFARFSFEAAKLAGCASTTVPQWAETLKKQLLSKALAYLDAEAEQASAYDAMAAADFGND